MVETVKVGTRRIGARNPCFIIAEAGSNHDGKYRQAIRLIDAAARAGADAVKFQTFRASRLYHEKAGRSDYLKLKDSIREIIRRMEMPYDWIPKLARHCRRRGILFISTPFDEESADRLAPFVDVFKVASYELTHRPLLKHLVRFRKPLLVSTGAAELREVSEAVRYLKRIRAGGFALMQCTASYPAPLASINVSVLVEYRERFRCPSGLSDHSRDPLVAPMTAVALGADVLEKHFTLDNRLPGPDHRFAVTPPELSNMVRRMRQVEAARGDGRKIVHPVERELRRFARRSIFATRDLSPGTVFTTGNIAVLRNGKMKAGLPPARWERVLGRKARRSVRKGEPITSAVVGR